MIGFINNLIQLIIILQQFTKVALITQISAGCKTQGRASPPTSSKTDTGPGAAAATTLCQPAIGRTNQPTTLLVLNTFIVLEPANISMPRHSALGLHTLRDAQAAAVAMSPGPEGRACAGHQAAGHAHARGHQLPSPGARTQPPPLAHAQLRPPPATSSSPNYLCACPSRGILALREGARAHARVSECGRARPAAVRSQSVSDTCLAINE